MLRRLRHRGPDGQGAVALDSAWLGHRRLSIVDTGGGRQPLATEDGRMHLVGNGEIYNHEEVRRTLEGVRFSTDSDNEVALHLVERHGPGALRQLAGMFAFLIAGNGGCFVAARDPVGIKPLYWAQRDGQVRFASEIRAFDANWHSEVELFPPGHYWTPQEGLVRFATPVPASLGERFAPPNGPDAEPPPGLVEELRSKVEVAIERHLMADGPVGVFLSGGLDSSIVAAVAAEKLRQEGKTLQTFAVGSKDSADLELARIVAEHLGTEHHERVFTAEEARAILPEVVRTIESYDPSLVRSAVPNYFLSEMAASSVKVVLTGEGADELFAGYEYHRAIEGHSDLHDELVRTVESLHGLNLQRCDRVTMIHGLEARVPFLDLDVIAFSLAIPAEWKLQPEGRPEKWLLRLAFEGTVPDEVLWREKAEFGDGSGAALALIDEAYGDGSGNGDGPGDGGAVDGDSGNGSEPLLRSDEEAAYYRIFRDHFGDVSPERTITLFATA
ncbi:MAG: asparagine synthase (glutamine-hydrolyzing) [Actinomycetota bacterium]|nr:asparagine synthase (glutamine-hydrolyzing) [Actinomycetota bacterium]